MTCNGEHKNILFIGEGNFSFSKSLVVKHNENHHQDGTNILSITASDLYVSRTVFDHFNGNGSVLIEDSFNIDIHGYYCDGCLDKNFRNLLGDKSPYLICDNCTLTINNINWLINANSTIIFGLNASLISQSTNLENRYSKIYWVMPHDRSSYSKTASLPHLISNFCISASQLQEQNDKIHLVISQQRRPLDPTYHTHFQQGKVYNIIESPFIAGYILSKRILVNNQRYPNYSHQITQGTQTVTNGMFPEEFVFTKRNIEDLNVYTETARQLREVDAREYFNANSQISKEYHTLISNTYLINGQSNAGLFESEGFKRFIVRDTYLAPVEDSDNYDESDDDDDEIVDGNVNGGNANVNGENENSENVDEEDNNDESEENNDVDGYSGEEDFYKGEEDDDNDDDDGEDN